MTLLTLGLVVPAIEPSQVHATLASRLVGLLPNVAAFALAFLALAATWQIVSAHQRYVERYNQTLSGILFYLLLVAVLFPFSASLLGTYPDEPLSVIVFLGNLAVLFALVIAHWEYIARHERLTAKPIDAHYRRVVSLRLTVPFALTVAFGIVAVWVPRTVFYGGLFLSIIWTAPGLAKLVWYRRGRGW
jgi:uncharacterized membrane protein